MDDEKYEYSKRRKNLLYQILIAFTITTFIHHVTADDAAIMEKLAKSFTTAPSGWSGSNPCKWSGVTCASSGEVTSIDVMGKFLSGEIPPEINQLSSLQSLILEKNQLTGSLPPLSKMPSLQEVRLDNNNFSSVPPDFLSGLSGLQEFSMDENNNLSPWTLPNSLTDSTSLTSFSATGCNLMGPIPDIFGSFPSLQFFRLSYNNLSGTLPPSLGKSGIQTLHINNQMAGLHGTIDVIGSMKELNQAWLHMNRFTGPIPDLSELGLLFDLQLRDNLLTGVIPASIEKHPKLVNISLQNNKFQGPEPSFSNNVQVSLGTENSFCNTGPEPCDPRVTTLLQVSASLYYPMSLADSWKGNDPCKGWDGITCSNGAITVINFAKHDFSGTISPAIANLTSLRSLILSDNKLYGHIPDVLTHLSQLQLFDISNNNISGKVPTFPSKVAVKTAGNEFIGKDVPIVPPPGSPGSTALLSSRDDANSSSTTSTWVIIVSILAAVIVVVILCLVIFKCCKKNPEKDMLIKDSEKGKEYEKNEEEQNLTSSIAVSSEVHSETHTSHSNSELSAYDGGHFIIPVEVLREVTNNFSEDNVLGRGGFGIVYKGQLHDGTMIAVKRMEASLINSKGLNEFRAEIEVLTKVRHRHLVALHGFCENGNERLLVYEYMPQGTLSQHLFEYEETGVTPLTWKQRLTIALDVARGVEYLHELAQQSFIHRDLKPSNVLLGDDMRAKVSDFGLVKSAPNGNYSVETKLAGTFGYLAPEYAATGRVTIKVDVYAFGVILMELITGRKALDDRQPDEKAHLVTWFRRSLTTTEAIKESLDPNLNPDEKTFESICKVVELAGHCTAREANQRPDMGHAVNVLAPLVETWTPSSQDQQEAEDDNFGIDLHLTLPQTLQRWKTNDKSTTMSFTDTYSFATINAAKKNVVSDSTGSFSSKGGE